MVSIFLWGQPEKRRAVKNKAKESRGQGHRVRLPWAGCFLGARRAEDRDQSVYRASEIIVTGRAEDARQVRGLH